MEKINLIEFNGKSVEAISYNGTDLDTLIYNGNYYWNKEQELMYLIGMSTGSNSAESNFLFDKALGLYEGPTPTLKNATRIGLSGPSYMISKTSKELYIKLEKFIENNNSYQEVDFDDYIRKSFVDDYGYIFYTNTSTWIGGQGGESEYRLTLNGNLNKEDSEYQYGRRVYVIRKAVDENNHWFFEDFQTTKIIKHGFASTSGSIIFNYYPATFESIPDIPNIRVHSYTDNVLYNLSDFQVSSLSNGMISNISISKIDFTTFRLDYELSANSTGKYRDCSIALCTGEYDDVELQIIFILEPNANDRAYYIPGANIINYVDNFSTLFNSGSVKNLNQLTTIGPLDESVLIAIPYSATISSTNANVTLTYQDTYTWEGKEYKLYTTYGYLQSYNLQITLS